VPEELVMALGWEDWQTPENGPFPAFAADRLTQICAMARRAWLHGTHPARAAGMTAPDDQAPEADTGWADYHAQMFDLSKAPHGSFVRWKIRSSGVNIARQLAEARNRGLAAWIGSTAQWLTGCCRTPLRCCGCRTWRTAPASAAPGWRVRVGMTLMEQQDWQVITQVDICRLAPMVDCPASRSRSGGATPPGTRRDRHQRAATRGRSCHRAGRDYLRQLAPGSWR